MTKANAGETHRDPLVEEVMALLPPFDPEQGFRTFGPGFIPWTLGDDVARARIAQLPATTVRAMIDVLPTFDLGRRDDFADVCHSTFDAMYNGLDGEWAQWWMHRVANILAFSTELGLLPMQDYERKVVMARAMYLFETGEDAPQWVRSPKPLPADYLAADAATRGDAAAVLVAGALTAAAADDFPEAEGNWTFGVERMKSPHPELVALARLHGAQRLMREAYAQRTIDPSALSAALDSEAAAI